MDIVFYVIIFILGASFGSIHARILERISKEKSIFDTHSYCANCGKKLSFFEQIPILSYVFLGGKCKHCKKKIEVKYIILEIITGILLLVAARGVNLSITDINLTDLISFIFIILYLSYIILTVGADKQSRSMPSTLLGYGIAISLIYTAYCAITETTAIYANIVYLSAMIILLLVNIFNTKKRAQSSYVIDLLTMLLVMLIFTKRIVCILTIIGTLISIALYILINKIKKTRAQKDKTVVASNIKIVYIMGILNLLIFLALINIFR